MHSWSQSKTVVPGKMDYVHTANMAAETAYAGTSSLSICSLPVITNTWNVTGWKKLSSEKFQNKNSV